MFKLREISRNDIEKINKWRNNKNLIDNLGATYRFIDKEIDFEWFENYLKSRNNTVRCVILNNENVIGLITLSNINYINRNAIMHIMIGETSEQNNGAGTYAIKEILDYAFNSINLNRVELNVLENNERAIYVYTKNGFVKEGIKREYCYKNGNYLDMIIMSILKKEYNSLKESNENTK